MRAAHDHSITDGTFATVLRVTGQPEHVWQGFYREVDGLDVPYFSRALVGEAARSDRDVQWLENLSAANDIFERWRGNVRESHKAQARNQKLEEHTRLMFDSQFSQSYSILIALRAQSLDELEEQVIKADEHLARLNVSYQRIRGAERQYPALWAATLGINTL